MTNLTPNMTDSRPISLRCQLRKHLNRVIILKRQWDNVPVRSTLLYQN